MINNDTFDLLTDLVDNCYEERGLERRLRRVLQTADEATRSEIAYTLHDLLQTHPSASATILLSNVERYIATRLKLSDWFARKQELDMDLDELMAEFELEMGLLSDDLDQT